MKNRSILDKKSNQVTVEEQNYIATLNHAELENKNNPWCWHTLSKKLYQTSQAKANN